MGCEVCSSDNHSTEKCPLIGKTKINDNPLPQRAFLTLPTELETREHDGVVDIVPSVQLTKGTQFGPVQGLHNKRCNPNCPFMLPIFHKSRVLHYLDTTNLDKSNWMSLVQFTTNEKLRNTICYQLKNEIFFSVVEDVSPGQSLVVGYSPGYLSLMEQCGIRYSKQASKQSNEKKKLELIEATTTELNEDSDTTYDHDYIVPTDLNNEGQIPEAATPPSKAVTTPRTSKRLRLKRSQRKDENNAVKNSQSVEEITDDTVRNNDTDSEVFEANRDETTEPIKTFLCEVCGATYSNSSSLKTHRSIHSERRFVCLICCKSFSRKSLLIEHSFVHGDPKFSCSVCGKRMKTLKSLTVHKVIHSEQKPFSCDICGKGFAQKINLQSHLRSHLPTEQKKQEICDKCGNAFSSREYLKLHLETHKAGDKFFCDICNAQFIRSYFLQQHKKAVHGNDVYKCELCSSNNKPHFRHKYSLQRHLVREHSEAKEFWEVEGYLSRMLVAGDGSLTHPKVKKVSKIIRSGNADQLDSAAEPSSAADIDNKQDSATPAPSTKKPRLSTKLAKLLEKEKEDEQLIFEVCHEMPEDLEIENEVTVGEDDDSSRTELTLTLDDETSELYSKSFTDHGNLKDENMVLLQVDDSGRYVIAFSHDLNLK